MPPARRLKRYKSSKHKTHIKIPWLYLGIVFLAISLFVLVVCFFILRPKNFDDNSKLSLVINTDENLSIYVIDPAEPEIVKIKIPTETEIDSARDLGKFKAGNIWQLGQNEKIGGKLLQEGIVKNFGFPVSAWADSEADKLFSGNILQKFSVVFSKFDSNLSVGDKFKIALFTMRNVKKKEIDLSETSFLRKTRFMDGESGYTITQSIPSNLVLVFTDSLVSKKQLKVVLKNASGLSSDNTIPSVIEFSGGKVVSELREDGREIYCEVDSSEKEFAKKIAEVFGCTLKLKKAEGNFDVEITIGKEFLKRY